MGEISPRNAKLQMGMAPLILAADSMRVWLLAVILLLLAAASALFSALETAFFSLQPWHVRRLRTQNPRLADRLSRLLENPRRVLSALLLADAMVNVPLIVLSLYTLREAARLPVPFWLAAAVIFALIAIVCDLAPKVIALGEPYRLAMVGARVMSAAAAAAGPGLARAATLERADRGLGDAVAAPGAAGVERRGTRDAGAALGRGGHPRGDRERDDPGNPQAGRQDRPRLHDAPGGPLRDPGRPDQRGGDGAAAGRAAPACAGIRRDAGRHRRDAGGDALFPESGGALHRAIEPALLRAGDDEGARPAQELHQAPAGDGGDRGRIRRHRRGRDAERHCRGDHLRRRAERGAGALYRAAGRGAGDRRRPDAAG